MKHPDGHVKEAIGYVKAETQRDLTQGLSLGCPAGVAQLLSWLSIIP